jgi:hypothetical protein
MEFVRSLGRITSLSFLSGFVRWRWALVVSLFTLAAGLVQDTLQWLFRAEKVIRPVDVWDMFPALLAHYYVLHALFAFGFLLFIGDHYHRQRESGNSALFALRLPSRRLYWLGNMATVGINALLFMTICYLMTLVVGFIMVPPASYWPMLPRETLQGLSYTPHLPAPVFSLLLALYTAWGLWISGSLVMLVSTFFKNTSVLLGVISGWVLVSLAAGWDVPFVFQRFVLLGELIGFHKHYGEHAISLGTFFLVSSTMLFLIALVGSWRMQREEL